MASELTARLHGRRFASCSSNSSVTSDGSRASGRSATEPPLSEHFRSASSVSSKRESAVSSSGYIGDAEQRSPLVTIDLLDPSRKRRGGSSGERDAKRQKQLENQYLAATVKEQLARAGLDLPKLNLTESPCDAGIDMSKVDHLYSKDVADSPFLPCPKSMPVIGFFETEHILGLLIRLAEASYNPPASIERTADQLEYESSTSSVTESENTDEEEKRTAANSTMPPHFSLGDALSLSSQARLVTLANSPYIVVHTNAAFSQITGIPSVRVLGRPVGEVLEDSTLSSCLKSCHAEFKVKILDRLAFKSKSTQKCDQIECNLVVSPVGSSPDTVTHMSIELRVGDALSGRRAEESALSVVG